MLCSTSNFPTASIHNVATLPTDVLFQPCHVISLLLSQGFYTGFSPPASPKIWLLTFSSLLLQVRKGQERTVLQVVTQRVEQLPLADVAVQDFGDTNQKFGFELGPVCFSG